MNKEVETLSHLAEHGNTLLQGRIRDPMGVWGGAYSESGGGYGEALPTIKQFPTVKCKRCRLLHTTSTYCISWFSAIQITTSSLRIY